MIERGRTHMFCRAMDSRRSVMEGKDETEKEGRGEREILRPSYKIVAQLFTLISKITLISKWNVNWRLVVRKFFYIISIPYSRLVSTTSTFCLQDKFWMFSSSLQCNYSWVSPVLWRKVTHSDGKMCPALPCVSVLWIDSLTFQRSLQGLQAGEQKLVTRCIHHTAFLLGHSGEDKLRN